MSQHEVMWPFAQDLADAVITVPDNAWAFLGGGMLPIGRVLSAEMRGDALYATVDLFDDDERIPKNFAGLLRKAYAFEGIMGEVTHDEDGREHIGTWACRAVRVQLAERPFYNE